MRAARSTLAGRRGRLLAFVILAASCSEKPGSTRWLPPVEPVRAGVKELRVDDCRWIEIPERRGSGLEPEGETMECAVTHLGPATWKYLVWTARDEAGVKVAEGGSGGLLWDRPGERRRVKIDLAKGALDRVARIEIEPE